MARVIEDTVQAYPPNFASVRGRMMAYVEVGEGDPIVFLHGNPTSSFLWRDVIPHLADCGRCLAPDLIGMGESQKLAAPGPGSYRFVEHREYLDAWFDKLGVRERVTLVVHDWGSALGFDWARRHPDAIKGIAYMEAIVRPLRWQEWPEAARGIFEAMRSPEGERLVLDKNLFLESILPASIQRKLSAQEIARYRAPFVRPGEDRRPMLTWPREIPLDGEPADVCEIVHAYADWLSGSPVPKLFINADPGIILVGEQREFCRAWPNQTELTVKGLHFIQEDSPHEIGEAVRRWYAGL